ncbi:MAG: hydrogen peroxide-inducible genes activator [Candidatus Polarisedimenticolaceae bacterium]|nr:hydrogen peroxide-inducible genes activator [Candidatus Polarisedimenticolaceae bacterium]
MNLPTLRQLKYLVAVVELRHFGQAAKRCFVTQSTLSAGIQELESLLGTQLLERSKRKVLPTPLGIKLSQRAEQLISLAGEMVEIAHDDGTPLSGPLRLGVIPTIGPFLLPKVLPGIRHAFPKLELSLREERSDQLLKQLEAGRLDAVVMAFPYPIGNMQSQIFWQENFLVALPKGNPLASADTLSSDALPKEELLMLEEGHCLSGHALAACKLSGLKISAHFQGTSLYTLVQMVAGGLGITFLPAMAANSELMHSGEIVLLPLAEPGPHRQIGLVWRKSYFRQDDLHLLAHHFRELLREKL